MAKNYKLRVNDRELASLLAGLRLYEAAIIESDIPVPIDDIATDYDKLEPLDRDEIDQLCSRLNTVPEVPNFGLRVEPPAKNSGTGFPAYRVVYEIDVNAQSALGAAQLVSQIMADPDSLPPTLHVIDHTGKIEIIDLVDYATQPGTRIEKAKIAKAKRELPHDTQWVGAITVIDPDAGMPNTVDIYKDFITGAMVGIDWYYLAQTDGVVRDPYHDGVTLDVHEDEEDDDGKAA